MTYSHVSHVIQFSNLLELLRIHMYLTPQCPDFLPHEILLLSQFWSWEFVLGLCIYSPCSENFLVNQNLPVKDILKILSQGSSFIPKLPLNLCFHLISVLGWYKMGRKLERRWNLLSGVAPLTRPTLGVFGIDTGVQTSQWIIPMNLTRANAWPQECWLANGPSSNQSNLCATTNIPPISRSVASDLVPEYMSIRAWRALINLFHRAEKKIVNVVSW